MTTRYVRVRRAIDRAVLYIQPPSIIEPRPDKNQPGALITVAGQKIAVEESPEKLLKLMRQSAQETEQ